MGLEDGLFAGMRECVSCVEDVEGLDTLSLNVTYRRKKVALAMVDSHLRDLGDRLNVTIIEDRRYPMYGAFTRAYAHHAERRNSHMRVPMEQDPPEENMNLGLAITSGGAGVRSVMGGVMEAPPPPPPPLPE